MQTYDTGRTLAIRMGQSNAKNGRATDEAIYEKSNAVCNH